MPGADPVQQIVHGLVLEPVADLPPDALAPGENNLTLTFAQVGSFPSEGKGQPGGAPVRAAAQLLRVLPRASITRAVGRLVDAELPASLSSAVVGLYARAYKVDLDEAAPQPGEVA